MDPSVSARRRAPWQAARVVRDGGRAIAVGEQPVMPDTVEALRQHMHQEPANELVRGERHRLVPLGPLDPVILVFERDAGLVRRDQSPVGDGDAMRVAR